MSDPLPNINWAGKSLHEKYTMMHSGPGGAAVEHNFRALAALKQALDRSVATTGSMLGEVGVSWQGQAADAFHGSMSTSRGWAQASGQVPEQGSAHVQTYSNSYTNTRNAIPNPAEVGTVGGLVSYLPERLLPAAEVAAKVTGTVLGVQFDQALQIQKLRELNRKADAVLQAHVESTNRQIGDFPTVEAPPPITTAGGSGPPAEPQGNTGSFTGPGSRPPGVAHPAPAKGAGGAAGGAGGGSTGGTSKGAAGGPAGGLGGEGTPIGTAGGALGKARKDPGTSAAGYRPAPLPKPDPTGGVGTAGLGGGSVLPDRDAPPPPMTIANGGSYAGGLGGIPSTINRPNGGRINQGRINQGGRPTPRRVMGEPEPTAPPAEQLGRTSGAGGARPGAALPPGGGMGGAREERRHRNNTYIPSDDPFRMTFPDVTPGVLDPEFVEWLAQEQRDHQ